MDHKPLKLLDLFSGIGGFSYAAETLVGGFKTVQFVETDIYCQKILNQHWTNVPIHADITTFTAEPGMFDVITAGFPCQDLSSAGKQRGLQAERSGLFYEVIRLARELRPQFVLFENVGNLLSHQNGETFQEVLFQIAKAGFDAEWAVIPASDVGACHQRKRIWIIAYKPGRQKLLTDSDSLHSERRGETEYMARKTRASKGVCQERKRDGNAFNNRGANAVYPQSKQCNELRLKNTSQTSESQLRNGDCSNAAHANHQGLQRRESVFVPEHSIQWVAGAGNSQLLSADWRTYVSEPALRRGDDGLSGRVDRLKALGNSIVPQVAAIPLQRIKGLSQNLTLQ